MNNFDTEFIAPEEIKLTDNPGNVSALTLEANVHLVDQGTTHIKELETNKKRKKMQKKVPRRYSLLEGRVGNQFDESASAFDIYEQIVNLYVLIEILVEQNNLHLQETWRKFLTNA